MTQINGSVCAIFHLHKLLVEHPVSLNEFFINEIFIVIKIIVLSPKCASVNFSGFFSGFLEIQHILLVLAQMSRRSDEEYILYCPLFHREVKILHK